MKIQEDLIVIMKHLIVTENELSRGMQPKDRLLILEALLKNITNTYTLDSSELQKWSELLDNLLIEGRKNMSTIKMTEYAQKLRKYRKKLENLNFALQAGINETQYHIDRAFNQKTNSKMKALLEPSFNVLEIYKQLLLLQDHLSDKTLRCPTCIIKHTLFAEALSEEAITLDDEGKYTNLLKKLTESIFLIRKTYILTNRNGYANMLKCIKKAILICEQFFNKMSPEEHKSINF